MTSIKDLEDALFEAVSKKIESYGFSGSKRDQCFYKRTPSGRLAFSLAFIRHRDDVDVTVHMAVRFDELEELVNEYENRLSKAQRKNTFSLGVELGNLSEGRQKRWTVASLQDVEPVANSIADAFVSVGLPYLQKYSDMQTALEVLSGDDNVAWLHSPFHDVRAKRALGLAVLLGDRERFSQLVSAKTEFLKSRNDPGLNSFLQFKDALEQRVAQGAADH
jgi:hypothetical protein